MSRPPGRLRVVFDCNTCIQAIAFDDGPASASFRLVEAGSCDVFVSKATLRELRRALTYPQVREMSVNLTDVRIAGFLERIKYRGSLVRRVPRKFEFPRDFRDEPYLDLVVAVQADYLVTRDNDLLDLMTDHSAFAKRFRQMTRPLQVVTPPDFLRLVSRPH